MQCRFLLEKENMRPVSNKRQVQKLNKVIIIIAFIYLSTINYNAAKLMWSCLLPFYVL